MAQVKHYISSTHSQLLSSLKREVKKVDKLKPKKYFLFVSKNLTPAAAQKVSDMFGEVVEIDQSNVFTLSVMDALLQSREYSAILEKYPSPWNFSVDVLSSAVNKSSIFDSAELMHNAAKICDFVPMEAYSAYIEKLEEERNVLVQGRPGSGKTITSIMAALDFANRGYKIRYGTDGRIDVKKNTIGTDEEKEVIFLDDFFGQRYYCIDGQRTEELKMLPVYIKRNKNECLILNSCMTILREGVSCVQRIGRFFAGHI